MHICHSGLISHCWWIQQSKEIEGMLVSFVQTEVFLFFV